MSGENPFETPTVAETPEGSLLEQLKGGPLGVLELYGLAIRLLVDRIQVVAPLALLFILVRALSALLGNIWIASVLGFLLGALRSTANAELVRAALAGRPISFAEALSRGLANAPRFVALTLACLLLTLLGLIALVIPGLVAYVAFVFAPYAALFGLPAKEALRTSAKLSAAHVGTTLLLVVTTDVLPLALSGGPWLMSGLGLPPLVFQITDVLNLLLSFITTTAVVLAYQHFTLSAAAAGPSASAGPAPASS
ncbi:MAG: hypothetical protein U1E65_06570 [Myxococcota bacterium]